jgi:hypothetical protein
MYSNASFFFARSHYGLVNFVAIHTFSAELGQESRMYIYDFIGISMQKQIRHADKETCQHDKVNAIFLQNSQNFISGCPVLLREHVTGHFQTIRTFQNVGITFIRKY